VDDRWIVGTGVVVAVASVGPPLDAAADTHLTAHMIQHVLLVSVAAPFLGVGLARALQSSPSRIGRTWRVVVEGVHWPQLLIAAGALHVAVLVGWHAPALYDAAVRHDALHAGEHLSMLATAAAFWALVVPAVAHERRGLAVVAVFVFGMAVGMLGVAMTLAHTAWYPLYATRPNALADQQMAGVVMWAYGGLASIVAGITLFVSWLAAQERASAGWPEGAVPVVRGDRR
jgi:cytochrome c oxidase assembly factor CtaG